MQIDIWSDVACPWCFIGKRRFEAALSTWEHRDEVEVTWHSFQLDPTLPEHFDGTEIDYLASRKGLPPEQVRQMFAHVTQQAAGEGLAYDFDRLVVANSLRAHQLLHLAKAHGAGDAVKEALLSGHFEQGTDIGDVELPPIMGLDQALLIVGSTPPRARYFSFGQYLFRRFDADGSLLVRGSIAPMLNQHTLELGDTPFEQPVDTE